jgi:hypothetical protein
MSIKITYNGQELLIPGAYTKFQIANKGDVPLASSGTVGIIGEAEGGEGQVLDVITRSQFNSAIERYKAGPIADAIQLLNAPSKDGRILGGASKIVIYKVNNSTQSELTLNTAKIVSKNYGTDENGISVLLSEGAIEGKEAELSGSIDGPFAVTAADTLILKIAGTTYTYTAPATVAAQTAAQAKAALENAPDWSPSLPIAIAENGLKIDISVLDTVAKEDASYIYVDPASTSDTIYGLIGEARGNKGSRVLISKKGVISETSKDVGGVSAVSVKYDAGTGTKCELSVKVVSGKLHLSTDTGVPAEDLAIDLEDNEGLPIHSFQTLVDFVNAKAEYSASILDSGISQKNAIELDFYDAIDCQDVAVELNRDMFLLASDVNPRSEFVNIERTEDIAGSIDLLNPQQFLVGGTYGTSATSNFLDGFEGLKEQRINIAVPLISEDLAGKSIESINAIAEAYAREGWTTLGKSERNVYVSLLGDKNAVKDAARTLGSEFCSLLAQDIRATGASGELKWFSPWAHACIYAGMQAGSETGEPTTFKRININDIRVGDSSWNPLTDSEELIEAGVSVSRGLDTGGFEIIVGNTTYGVDENWMKNRTSVMEAGGFVLYDLRFQLEKTFTGTKARTGGEIEIKNFIKDRMESYLDADITVGNDGNDFLGYRALEVAQVGSQIQIDIIITTVEGRDFILPSITFERNRSVA